MILEKIKYLFSFFKFLFASEDTNNKLDYLEGFRGALANWVFFHHGVYLFPVKNTDYMFFEMTGYFIGVNGFFILSAFLLTYRLLTQLNMQNNSLKKIFIAYFIRRFFRIYLPFVVFVTLVKFVKNINFGGYYSYSSWSSIVKLQSVSALHSINETTAHLWTISPEIKYYFFIPFFAFATYKAKKYWYLWNFFIIFSIIFIQKSNLFSGDLSLHLGSNFFTRFTIFFSGSILGVLYYDYRESKLFDYIKQKRIFREILGFLSMVLYINGIKKYSTLFNPGITILTHTFESAFYMFIVMALMLFSQSNFFNDIFNKSYLKYGGKFSFGIYLFHPMCISYIFQYFSNAKFKAELFFYLIISSYTCGFLFYFLVENLLIKISNYIIKKIFT